MGRKPKAEQPDPRWISGADSELVESLFDFDFASHMEAVRRGERQEPDYAFMLLAWFARDRESLPEWALEEIRLRVLSVLRGASWPSKFPLPWLRALTADDIHSPAAIRQYKMGAAMYGLLNDDPTLPVGVARDRVADEFHADPRHVERAWKELRERLWIPPRRTDKKS